ncbi:GNAT family N-acetyltransferase [bacterium]|nr:GNAT family N-acetyltransferase [bacterium]
MSDLQPSNAASFTIVEITAPSLQKAVMKRMKRFVPFALSLFVYTAKRVWAAVPGEPVLDPAGPEPGSAESSNVDVDSVCGVLTGKTFPMSKNRRAGILSWAAVDPAARGQGLGRALYERAVHDLTAEGAEDLFGCIEGLNPASYRLLQSEGFVRMSFTRQLRRYGVIGLLRVWFGTVHIPDVGHFLWVRRADGEPLPERHSSEPSQAAAWFGNLLASVVLLLATFWRWNPSELPGWEAVVVAAATLLLLYGTRELAMRAVAARLRLPVRFRAWESGYNLSIAIALLFGGVFPVPGNLYPADEARPGSNPARTLGPVAAAGAVAILMLTGAAEYLKPLSSGLPASILAMTAFLGKTVALFDIVFAFFPFVAYNGCRIWAWNRLAWGVFAATTLALFFV